MFRLSKRTWVKLGIAVVLLAVACNGAWNLLDNFHEVIPGELYRSGQLSAAHLQARAARNGIRTVINLRGPNLGEAWYRDEVVTAQGIGLIHIDLPIDSLFPTKDEIRDLANALKDCPKPVLIHCQSGIDRTGIASGLACLLLDDNSSGERALDQLSWRFGCLPGRKSREAKRDFLLAYDSWLHGHGFVHSRLHFCAWLQEVVQIGDLGQK